MNNKAAALLLSYVLVINMAFAQVFISERLTSRNGLSSDNVTALVKDKWGGLWIGTSNGLNHYDGYRIQTYLHNPLDSTSLPFRRVHTLYADSKGGIWICGENKVAYLAYGSLTFQVWKFKSDELTFAVNEDDLHHFYLGTTHGFYELNEQYTWKKLNDYPVYTIRKQKDYFLLSSRSSLYKFNYLNKKVEGNYADQFPYLGGKIYSPSSAFLVNKHLIIHNGWSGLTDANLETEKYITLHHHQDWVQENNPVPALWVDSTLNVWAGTTRGLYYYNPADTALLLQKEAFATPAALQHQFITALSADSRGNLWAGTSQNGVYCVAALSHLTQPVYLPVSPLTAVKTAAITDGNLFLGTLGQGLFQFSPRSNTVQSVNQKEFKNVYAITKRGNECWMGTEHGLYLYMPEKKTFALHKLYTDTLNQTITAVTIDRDGSLWLGSTIGLIHYYPHSKDVFIYRSSNNVHSISSDDVRVLFTDSKARLWVGTNKGLDAFNTEKNVAERFGQVFETASEINCITEDRKGNIWVGTQQGALYKLNPTTRKCENVLSERISPNSPVQSVMISEEPVIWFTTTNSLCRYNEIKNRTDEWTTENGLPATGFSSSCLLPLPDGRLFAGFREGALLFPHLLPATTVSGLPVISRIFVNGKPHAFIQDFMQVAQSVKELIILIGDADLHKGGWIKFQYRLKGYSDDWSDIQHQFIGLSGLPEGDYELEIRGAGRDADNFSEVKRMSIRITPPIWKTPAFILLCSVLVVGLSWWFLSRTLKGIRIREHLKHELTHRKLELQQQAFQAQLDSQFISNTLYQVQECMNTNQLLQASQYLSKFSSYISCVLEYGNNEFITIEQLTKTIDYYLSIERLRLNGDLQYTIACSPKINPQTTYIPNMVVQPYVENAIWHGLKQKVKDRKVEIRFEPWSKQHVLCTIEDNGIGRKAAAHLRSSRIDLHGSAHARIAEQRLDLLNETLHTETRLEIVDLTSDTGEANGTKVILHLPVNG